MKLPQQFSQPRLITHQIEQLTGQLQRQLRLAKPDAKAVHAIRVACKQLRSWIRLLRHTGAADDWQRSDKKLRKLARKFAAARDSTVLLQTVRRLLASTRSSRRRAACRQVLRKLPPPAAAAKTASKTPLSNKLVRHLQASSKPAPPVLHQGLQLTHQRCLRLARTAFTGNTSSEALHRLRRWVKYLGYQLELVTVPAAANRKLAKQLVALGRILGRIHDLALLQQRLDSLPTVDPSARATVAAQASRLRRRLLVQAESATRLLFDF